MINSHLFAEPDAKQTLLRARGFHLKSGAKSGGIKSPLRVTLPAGAKLFRTYQDPSGLLGDWWFTPFEINEVINYFARDGSALAEGREDGKGILQATMAVRHEWGGNSPRHLSMVTLLQVKSPVEAFYGEGDVAPDASQSTVLKAVQILGHDRKQRGVRQIFLPDPATYQSAFAILERNLSTDVNLVRLAREHRSNPLPFEVY